MVLLWRTTITADNLQTIHQQCVCVCVPLKPIEKDGMVFIVICFQKPLSEELRTDCGNPLILWKGGRRCITLSEITGFVEGR